MSRYQRTSLPAIGYPQAGILPVPPPTAVGIGGLIVVVRIRAAAVAAQETHVVDQRPLSRAPQDSHGSRVYTAGINAETTEYIRAPGRR